MDSIWDKLPEGTATEVIEHYLPQDEQNCPKCGAEMEIIGKMIILVQDGTGISQARSGAFTPDNGKLAA